MKRSFNVVQILYKTSNGKMQPTVNVTSVIKSAFSLPGGIISYQSAYDSLNPFDSPSWNISNNKDLAGVQSSSGALAGLSSVEIKAVVNLSDLGFNVVIPDTEGETADFADGPEEGMTTLDSIQAALHTPATGLSPRSGAIMVGYSGGAIATDWAAQLAPSYAPSLNSNNLLGASLGGLLIDPVHNLQYVDGGAQWGGVAPMALIGMARGHGLDLTPYLNGTGLTNYNALQTASLYSELKQYQGLYWEDWLLPQYQADWANYLVTGAFSPEFNQ